MRTWTDYDLTESVKKNDCPTAVVRSLGLFVGQATLNRVRKRIEELGLDVSHFKSKADFNSSRRTWSEQDLRKAVEESWSITEVVRRLNLTVTSTNFRTVQRHIERLSLNASHFDKGKTKEKADKTREVKDLLIKGSVIESCRLRNKIISAGLLENKCYECGITEWRGKPLVLQLDHINGDRYDNRLENLRIICPNCHSQTETYGSKNKRKNSWTTIP